MINADIGSFERTLFLNEQGRSFVGVEDRNNLERGPIYIPSGLADCMLADQI